MSGRAAAVGTTAWLCLQWIGYASEVTHSQIHVVSAEARLLLSLSYLDIDMTTTSPASCRSLTKALTSTMFSGICYCFWFTMLTGVRGSFRYIHCSSSYPITQRPNVEVIATAKYIHFNYTLQDWGNDHPVGPWTHWIHQEPYFSQNSILPGSHKPLL